MWSQVVVSMMAERPSRRPAVGVAIPMQSARCSKAGHCLSGRSSCRLSTVDVGNYVPDEGVPYRDGFGLRLDVGGGCYFGCGDGFALLSRPGCCGVSGVAGGQCGGAGSPALDCGGGVVADYLNAVMLSAGVGSCWTRAVPCEDALQALVAISECRPRITALEHEVMIGTHVFP